ncbi:MAG: hypothetical protein QOF57_1974, partial [Frankiaceae bacterium]|nr:hypothetical protein [Frankiaceae bacterium]
HAFLVGAFDPNASVAIDKPPLDVWLQVAATKLFGFTPFALHLPEALASAAATILLYDLVRRGFGRGAGLAAAAAFAVLPAEVLTARSDTMDAAMAALLVLAAWLVVRAAERGRGRELYLAGAFVGLAFETKLFEALVAVPALALLFVLASDAGRRARIRQLAGAGATLVAVGLAWPLMFALLPAGSRPYPLGSTSGSIWNTVFVFNGIGRLQGSSTQSAVDRLSPAGPGRLFAGGPMHFDVLVGTSLAAALAFAVVALALGLIRRRELGRIPFAIAAAMGAWLLVAGVLLSVMSHVPVRYLEVLTPAIAAVFGISVLLVLRAADRRGNGRLVPVVTAVVVAAALAAPASQSLHLVSTHAADGGTLGAMPARNVTALSRYLTSHQRHATYEFAALEAHLAAPLIVKDARPVLILAGTPYHRLVDSRRLAREVTAGQVRYVLVSSRPSSHPVHVSRHARTRRGQMAAWVRLHGVDATRQAGLGVFGALSRLTAQAVGAG